MEMRVSASYEYIRLMIEVMSIEAGYDYLDTRVDGALAARAHDRYFGVKKIES